MKKVGKILASALCVATVTHFYGYSIDLPFRVLVGSTKKSGSKRKKLLRMI